MRTSIRRVHALTYAVATLVAGIMMAAATPPAPAPAPAAAAAPATIPAPAASVEIGGPFWGARLATMNAGMRQANIAQCELTGRFGNFDRAAEALRAGTTRGENPNAYRGLLFNDSDVYKVLEGLSWQLATAPNADARALQDAELDALIARVAAAQCPDGYINTYYTLSAGLQNRFTRPEADHEAYCMGHLIEAGVAHQQVTGKRALLDVAMRAADYLRGLYGEGKFTAPPGHQELELALVKLAAATDQPSYAEFAHELLAYRGRVHRKLDGTEYGPWGEYAQDHLPAADQREAAGHAVRAAYMYAAMADLAALGRAEYSPALKAIWQDVTERRIFITGGIGPSGHNEGFTVPFDIPIQGAYQETCASIGLCLWAHRMFLLEGNGAYMEQFERTLYNAVLAGVALDGRAFFYVNPMVSGGGHARQEWFSCACCPPNVLRFFGSLGQYIYAVRGDTVYVNLFIQSKATLNVAGQSVEVEQRTGYPFSGHVALTVRNKTDRDIEVAIRANAGMTSGQDGYGRMKVGAGGESTADWDIPMPPRRVHSDPRVKASAGHVAIARGPLIYAAEGVDNANVLGSCIVPSDATMSEEIDAAGVPVIRVNATRATSVRQGEPAASAAPAERMAPATLALRPYFMWANRGPGEMQVWFPETAEHLPPQPMQGVAASASFIGHGDGLGALTDRALPASSADMTVPRFTFWPRKGGAAGGAAAQPPAEWVQVTFDQPRTIDSVGVYWFDDTGRGECRVPRACVAEYMSGGVWLPLPGAEAGAVDVTVDTMNVRTFPPIVAEALRLSISLQPGMSAGILELSF